MSKRLSVALATFNEESNIERCLKSVQSIADEIIIVDGSSSDKTVQIAGNLGATVTVTNNPPIFHINKQKAIEQASGDWILQLDADEYVSEKLGKEITEVINMSDDEIETYEQKIPKLAMFLRHQKIVEERDGKVGETDKPYAAFFVPRANYFLGRYLRYGGVYPDGVIRLIKKGKAYLPAKDVHEQFVVEGKVGWLQNDLLHYDSPTLKKYLARNNRYTSLMAREHKDKNLSKRPFTALSYLLIKPMHWFLLTYFRHKGFLDSWQGFVFSFFSSLRFPISYIKYLRIK
jgi:glycosyltransferase involved in cell wall biosynthesis